MENKRVPFDNISLLKEKNSLRSAKLSRYRESTVHVTFVFVTERKTFANQSVTFVIERKTFTNALLIYCPHYDYFDLENTIIIVAKSE